MSTTREMYLGTVQATQEQFLRSKSKHTAFGGA